MSMLGSMGLKHKLTKMFEAGFKDFNVNKALLIKFNYNLG
jgi:hypothetical protein